MKVKTKVDLPNLQSPWPGPSPSALLPPATVAAPPPASSPSTSSSQWEDSHLLIIHIPSHSNYSDYSWLVKFRFWVHTNICLGQSDPGSLVDLPNHWILEWFQSVHLEADLSSFMLYYTMFPQGTFSLLFSKSLLCSSPREYGFLAVSPSYSAVIFTFGHSWQEILYPEPLLLQSPFPPFSHTIQSSRPHPPTLRGLDLRSLVILWPPLVTTLTWILDSFNHPCPLGAHFLLERCNTVSLD